jgi:hypothetical protein
VQPDDGRGRQTGTANERDERDAGGHAWRGDDRWDDGGGGRRPAGRPRRPSFQHLSDGNFDPGFSANEAVGVFGAAGLGALVCGTAAAAALHPSALVHGKFHVTGPRDAAVMAAAIAFGAAGVGANWVSESLRDNAARH